MFILLHFLEIVFFQFQSPSTFLSRKTKRIDFTQSKNYIRDSLKKVILPDIIIYSYKEHKLIEIKFSKFNSLYFQVDSILYVKFMDFLEQEMTLNNTQLKIEYKQSRNLDINAIFLIIMVLTNLKNLKDLFYFQL
ncbi:MAG: hypothetical protein Q8784_00875 [Vigna little leaf phytoplasma]|nr:hypothetical protein [Vigna little leaf phytoplasma]